MAHDDTTNREFVPLNIAVLTVSDSRTEATDTSGRTLVDRLETAGHQLADKAIEPDDIYRIRATVSRWIADPAIQAVITTGGTGITGRDGTPEAIQPLLDKTIDGFGEMFRSLSFQNIGTSTIQSRASGRRRERHLYIHAARLERRLQGRLGSADQPATRLPHRTVQPRRIAAAARRDLTGRCQT